MKKDIKPARTSLKEYARGITGGLLFSFPLLYTMEVWWAGFIAPPGALLIYLLVSFLLLISYNRYSGLRQDSSWRAVILDSVEEMGIGLILSLLILFILNRINAAMSIDEIMGKVVIEAMVVSIGVSIGTSQLGTGNGGGKVENPEANAHKDSKLAVVALAMCGGILVGGNVAPTQEVVVIAIESKPFNLLIMCLLSLVLSAIIVFFSDFKGSANINPENLTYHLLFDTCLCYITALGVSAFVLWFFGRFENTGFNTCFAEVIVLGVLSSLGASAGRLLIK